MGAGPSGLYAAAALAASGTGVDVDVLDRLPAPYGLVRYGVAPDHMKMKSVIRVLARPFGPGEVRFLGGVQVGSGPGQVPLPVLRAHYTAVVHATGCAVDRCLGIPGETMPGSIGSGDIVGWYCAHPDHCTPPRLDAAGVAVVGAGNVALDVARVLARTADELVAPTFPTPCSTPCGAARVRDVHVLIRRGPQHVKFTPVELRQLGDLADAEVVVHDDGLLATGIPDGRELTAAERANLAALAEWAHARPRAPAAAHPPAVPAQPGADPRRRPGHRRRRRAQHAGPDGRVRGTGEEETLDVGLVVRAVGYTAEPIPGLPFDAATGTVPNVAGRVVGADGVPVPGEYVTGWIRRGPTGVIGTNKHDAVEIAASVLADLPTLPAPGPSGSGRPGAGAGRARRAAGRLVGLAATGRRGDPPGCRRAGLSGSRSRSCRRCWSPCTAPPPGPNRVGELGRRHETAGRCRSVRRSARVDRDDGRDLAQPLGEQRRFVRSQSDGAGHGAVRDAVLDVRDELVDLVAAGGQRCADAQDAGHATGRDDLVAPVQAGLPITGRPGELLRGKWSRTVIVDSWGGSGGEGPEPDLGTEMRGQGPPGASGIWLSRRARLREEGSLRACRSP